MGKKTKAVVGLSALAAGVAGTVAFLKKNKHGQKMSSDAKKHATAVLASARKEAKKMKVSSKKEYDKMVNEVMKEYKEKKKLTTEVAGELSDDLKERWEDMKEKVKK